MLLLNKINRRTIPYWNISPGRIAAAVLYCLICTFGCGRTAAQSIPIVNAPNTPPSKPLKAEVVEIGQLMAMPRAINRPAGPFVLLLVNRTGDPNASFIVLPSDSNGVPSLVFDSHTPEVRHRRAGYLNLPPGKYSLETAAGTGVLCTITIE